MQKLVLVRATAIYSFATGGEKIVTTEKEIRERPNSMRSCVSTGRCRYIYRYIFSSFSFLVND